MIIPTASWRRSGAAGQSGSTLVAAVLIVFVLSLVAANVLTSVSSRYNSAYRSAAWNDALLAAESGVDVTLSEVFRFIPNVTMSPAQGIGVGYSQPSLHLIDGLQLSPAGLLPRKDADGTTDSVVSFNTPQLPNANQRTNVALQVVALNNLLANDPTKAGSTGLLDNVASLTKGNPLQLLRIVSTGTVSLPGAAAAGLSRQDNDLWRPSLIFDRFTQKAADVPAVSRQVEVMLRPVYPFESAVVGNDSLAALSKDAVFDSFNSASLTASTNQQYDSLKRLAHGTVRSNSGNVTIQGTVYGDIDTNGQTGAGIAPGSQVAGAANSAAFTPLPSVNAPTWNGTPVFASGFARAGPVTSVSGNTSVPAGTLVPTQYKFNSITGNLHITQGVVNALAQGVATLGKVEIYVNGDITGGIEVDPGIEAKIYVSGTINTKASQLKNDGNVAGNLQIYGVPNSSGTSQQIKITMNASLAAAVYAPAHDVVLAGANDFSGAIVSNTFQAADAIRVHYDEALGAGVGQLLRFEIASWKEVTK